LYQTEYNSLNSALSAMSSEAFNSVSLFSTGVGTVTVISSENASQSIDIDQSDLGSLTSTLNITSLSSAAGPSAGDITTINGAIQSLATMRATNGAQQSRLSFAGDLLAINKVNLEAANGRIIDVDVASESANLARFSILQQAGTAMLAQANQSQQSILRLLV
jgi:flagellin